MRVVIDTNVFVSLLIRPGKAFSALIDYIEDNATILYSAETLTELADVLRRPKFDRYTTAEDVAAFVKWLAGAGELVTIEHEVTGSRDPKDDKFLSLAVAGKADYLVSGDTDLLVMKQIAGIPIITPAEFLAAVNH